MASAAISAAACGGGDAVTRYYIYYLPDQSQTWEQRKDCGLAKEWSNLLGRKVTVEDVDALNWELRHLDDYDGKNPIIKSALRGDRELKEYLSLLGRLIDTSRLTYDSWDYPSREEIEKYKRNLRYIRRWASQYTGRRLSRQYKLMQMRASFALKDWNDCMRIWREAPKDKSVLTALMHNLYAGVLYRTGKRAEAFAIYSGMGDQRSASWTADKTGTVEGVRQYYDTDPNSPVLPYLIREFCNNTQETNDVLADISSKQLDGTVEDYLDWIGARQISTSSALQFVKLANEASSNPEVTDKAMWLNAAALVQYYFGNYNEALKLIADAKQAPSTEGSRLCTRYIAMFVNLATAPSSEVYSDLGIADIEWLLSMSGDTHAGRMLERLVHNELEPRFAREGRTKQLLAALQLANYNDAGTIINENGSQYLVPMYDSDYFNTLDTLPVSDVIGWAEYLRNGQDAWSKTAHAQGVQTDYMNDIIGTRLLRQGKFAEAREYLAKVSVSFLDRQNIAPYAAVRSFTDAPWRSRREKTNEYESVHLKRNAKLEYCDYMLSLEGKTSSAPDMMRLAAAYYTASPDGKCWWLTRYGVSPYGENPVAEGDLDFAEEARKLLKRAKTSDACGVLPIDILYAEAFTAPHDMYYYNDNTYEWELNRNSRQYAAYDVLADASNKYTRIPAYVTKCDILRSFIKER